jgi:gas vesicle protein
MTTRAETGRNNAGLNNGFLVGLMAGGMIGAGLAIAFAPRSGSELRRRMKASANDLRDTASERYEPVSARIAAVVDGVTAGGETVCDEVADAVGRGAREVEQFAMAAKSVPKRRRS